MENSQQTHNIFYDKINADFKSRTNEQTLKDLDGIIAANGNGLTLKQFQLVGSLAYLTGIDFTSQTQELSSKTLKNVTDRFIANNITLEIWTKFLETIKTLNIDNLVESKDLMKSAVTAEIKVDAQSTKMKHEIIQFIRSNYLPVKSVMNIDQLIKAKSLTYMQLLNFNDLVYNQMTINGNTINQIIKLLADEKFKEKMVAANDKFDDQKFALIYFDSIVTLLEFREIVNFESTILFNDTLIEQLKATEAEKESEELLSIKDNKPASERTPEEIEEAANNPGPVLVQENDPMEVDINETDLFFKKSLEESLEREILTIQDLHDAFESVYNNEDLLQHIYKFLRARIKENRKSTVEIFGIPESEIVNYFTELVDGYVTKYNELTKRSTAEIPSGQLSRLVNAVNDTIKATLTDDSDIKGYLIQQLYENQITTYKHLHQTIEMIEKCNISGSKLNTYVALRDIITYDDDITDIFKEGAEVEVLKLQAQFYTAVKLFYAELIEQVPNPAE